MPKKDKKEEAITAMRNAIVLNQALVKDVRQLSEIMRKGKVKTRG